MSTKRVGVAGILLVYYPEYFARALARFRRLLTKLDRNALLVVVNNGPLLPSSVYAQDLTILEGDNALREFSGWRVGIAHCRNEFAVDDNTLFILANDTFCHHNKFGPITEAAFVRAFRKIKQCKQRFAIGGEVNGGVTEMSILGQSFQKWVSTYLFAITSPLLAALDDLAVPCDMDTFFGSPDSATGFLTGPLNAALRRHVEHWLFDTSGTNRWYGAGALTPSTWRSYVGKAKSILFEMYLSASCARKQALIISVFHVPILRQLRRLERLLEFLPLMGRLERKVGQAGGDIRFS